MHILQFAFVRLSNEASTILRAARILACVAALAACVNSPVFGVEFPIRNMELLSRVPFAPEMDGLFGANDIWGWTDSSDGSEYAIVARQAGTSFFNITDPTDPIHVGNLPTHTSDSIWRDVKVYQDHAFIVSDNNGPHGMQVFDLTLLRGQTANQVWSETAHYDGFRNAHNISINEDTGFAYLSGSNQGGLYMVDIRNPTNPRQGRRFGGPYTHDAQVVIYNGPDTEHVGREISFQSSVSTLGIGDVTNKNNPVFLSSTGYENSAYAHQGWLSEDHRYFFMNDELDETRLGFNTRTHVWDVADLDSPTYVGFHEHDTRTSDHNLYVHNGLVYEANYQNGLRILEIVDASQAQLREVAYLDTYPVAATVGFEGAWSVYPFFDSGSIIVSDRQRGLFIARLNIIDIDFSDDDQVDCQDIDALIAEIADGGTNASFDLNEDGDVNLLDRDAWLAEAGEIQLGSGKSYLVGDANLDGSVDGLDFNAWNDHKFSESGGWCGADFNADGATDGQDFALWNAAKFTTSVVPEPSAMMLLLGSAAILGRFRLTQRIPPRMA